MSTRTDEARVPTGGIGGTAGGPAWTTGRRMAAVGAVLGTALVPAGAAHASVVGIGNAVFGNTCVSQDGAQAVGVTALGSGLAGGNEAGLPLSLPRNHCGNSGIVCTAVFGSSV